MALSEYVKAAVRPRIILGFVILAFGPIIMLFNQNPETELPWATYIVLGIFFVILLAALWTDVDKAVKAARRKAAKKQASETGPADPGA